MKEVFNILYHMRVQPTEIMCLPTSVRRKLFDLFVEQREYEKAEADKGRKS